MERTRSLDAVGLSEEVVVPERVEESFCFCGGEFSAAIASEGDGGGARADGYGEVVDNGAECECACVSVG